jgi:hypothetical protein
MLEDCLVVLADLLYYSHRRPKLKDHMQYCVDHPEEISKLAKVKAQVSEVKGVMMENIEKVGMHYLAISICLANIFQ